MSQSPPRRTPVPTSAKRHGIGVGRGRPDPFPRATAPGAEPNDVPGSRLGAHGRSSPKSQERQHAMNALPVDRFRHTSHNRQ